MILSSQHPLVRRGIAAHGLVLTCLLAGCQPTPHSEKVSGSVEVTITNNGEPVTEGSVNFSNNQTGLGGGADLDSDGVAEIAAVPVGDYVVTVIPPAPDPADPNPPVIEYPDLPEKFRLETSSPLKATVKEGSNEFKFDLKE